MSQWSCNFHATPASWVTFKMRYTLEIWFWIPKVMLFSKNLGFQTFMAILGCAIFPPPTGPSSECHQPFQRIAVASMAGTPAEPPTTKVYIIFTMVFFSSWKMWGKVGETKNLPKKNHAGCGHETKRAISFAGRKTRELQRNEWPLNDKLGKDMIRIQGPQDFLQNVR